jgi:hypothetical protein
LVAEIEREAPPRWHGQVQSHLFHDLPSANFPIQQPKAALQHPFWGGVSFQLPVPKAPLLQRSRLSLH